MIFNKLKYRKLGHSIYNLVKPADFVDDGGGFYRCNIDFIEWLEQFILYHFPERKTEICFVGVFGPRKNIQKYPGRKIFYTGENVEAPIRHKSLSETHEGLYWWFDRLQYLYGDYCQNEVDLAIGFSDEGERSFEKYLRFPLWLTYLFPADANYEKVKEILKKINDTKSLATRDAVCMNKHDVYGMRGKLCDDLKDVLQISFAGKWRHNDDTLWNEFNDDKLMYLRQFRFNICAENMDAPGYCTEKIFDSLRCGCIPIYAGCCGEPEPEVINYDAIIRWNLDGDNADNIQRVKKLLHEGSYYEEFMRQPKFKPQAADYVMDRLENLRDRIGELL